MAVGAEQLTRVLAWALVGVLAAGALSVGSARAAESPPPDGQRLGSRIAFHGWSPDAHLVAYTRYRRRPSKMPDRDVYTDVQQLHRVIDDGVLGGYGPRYGDDLAADATAHDYFDLALRPQAAGERVWEYLAPEGIYRLELEVGRRLFWKLSFEGRLIARRPCERVYVSLEATLHPAPDRRALVVVMHLDTGWIVDAAVLPVRLPQVVRDRWRARTGESAVAAP